jgi:hypothetical protein
MVEMGKGRDWQPPGPATAELRRRAFEFPFWNQVDTIFHRLRVSGSGGIMSEELLLERPAGEPAALELGVVLGQCHAFGLVAGRCSAAQVQAIRRMREEKLYRHGCETWEEFCSQYLKMSRSEADRYIRILEKFGPAYFELSQLTRVSPETYRAIAPAISDGALHHNGELIPLTADNSRKLAAAVAEMRGALAKKPCARQSHEETVEERIARLGKSCSALIDELEQIANLDRFGQHRNFVTAALEGMRRELTKIAIGLKAA